MKECNCGKIPPCYGSLERAIYEEAKKVNDEWEKSRARHGKIIDKLRGKLMEGGFADDTHDKVYELNRQMCDMGNLMSTQCFWDVAYAQIKASREASERRFAKYIKQNEDIMKEKKTKKMTKVEAFEWLKCKKVNTIGLGKEVQKKLFNCGVKWRNGKCEYYDFSDYLLIESNGDLYHCGNCGEAYWRMHHFEEISADDILSIEIVDGEDNIAEKNAFQQARNIMKWLREKRSPHTLMIIDGNHVELLDGVKAEVWKE